MAQKRAYSLGKEPGKLDICRGGALGSRPMDILGFAARFMHFYIPFLFALCFHEYAHGFVAKLCGDNTAKMMGRLTMNPLAHIDPIGTFLLPVISTLFQIPLFFGWAKPVPVNSRNFKHPKNDMFWVALAGPASNILLAFVGWLGLIATGIFFFHTAYFQTMISLLAMFIQINLFLAFFNLIPVNPLDGGKILARFLPASVNYKLEQNQQMISLILMALFIFGPLRQVLSLPVEWTYEMMVHAAERLMS